MHEESEEIRKINEIIAEADRLARERNESFEGWLWYLLQPPIFVSRGNEIIIEYPNLDYTLVKRFKIDKNKRKLITVEVEEIE